MTDTVAVIDVGRARLKVTRWTCNGSRATLIERGTVELSSNASSEDIELSDLRRLLVQELAKLEAAGDRIVVTGGSRLRDEPAEYEVVRASAEEHGASFRALTAEDEGVALAKSYGLAQSELLLDVGGGSLQIMWLDGRGRLNVHSSAHGTYALEKRFGLKLGCSAEMYEKARAVIMSEMPSLPLSQRVVVGSNHVGDFFSGLSGYLSLDDATWHLEDLNGLMNFCVNLPESEFESVMPSLPSFMFGADKLLLVVSVVALLAGASEIVGTNASISHGAATAACSQVKI